EVIGGNVYAPHLFRVVAAAKIDARPAKIVGRHVLEHAVLIAPNHELRNGGDIAGALRRAQHELDDAIGVRKGITPPPGELMWNTKTGSSPRPAHSIPLFARVLVLAAGERRLALITLDLGL